ncbi:MAG: flagellar biosynthetic protein FliR [Phycisphaerae bacterium]
MSLAPIEILFSLPHFALVLLRMGGLMLTAPLLASGAIPVRIRVGFTVALSLMMLPLVGPFMPRELSLPMLVGAGVSEMLIGATIGMSLTLILMSADLAGSLVGQQGGLALGAIFDPMLNRNTTVTGQLYTVVFTFIYLSIGGHRATLAALLDTYQAVPPLTYSYNDSTLFLLVDMLTAAFVLAIRVSGPVLIALFLVGTAMGFLSRTMPQFNVLSVGFTIRAMLAIGTAGIALTACGEILSEAIWRAVVMTRLGFGLQP